MFGKDYKPQTFEPVDFLPAFLRPDSEAAPVVASALPDPELVGKKFRAYAKAREAQSRREQEQKAKRAGRRKPG